MGIFPRTLGVYGRVDWIPVDEWANIVVELVHHSFDPSADESERSEIEEGARVFN
jgi:hypothetical protein